MHAHACVYLYCTLLGQDATSGSQPCLLQLLSASVGEETLLDAHYIWAAGPELS